MRRVLPSILLVACLGCNEEPSVPDEGEIVTPPFEVSGEAEGLLLVWFDEEGAHSASRRSEIPEAHRAMVRVDDLSSAPEEGLDPSLVYVADLTRAEGGRYEVRRMPRDAFEARVEAASARELAAPVADADADVIIYGASWCGACRSTAAFLRQRDVPFVERDIERDPGARQAMTQAARAAGVSPTGIPVIDFRGRIIAGFDRAALEQAIEATEQDRAPAPI